MAEEQKQPIIVIKKITVNAAGHHGGSWKVAFADFMTAMMAFFLVMWLLGQSDETKKNVADYFSTPSIIEYNFSNYGVELTLEKLFLDLVNEPLKFFQSFIKPVDATPNLMAMGVKKIVLHHIADKLGDLAEDVNVDGNNISFDLSADKLFMSGTAELAPSFVAIMESVRTLTAGLEDSDIFVDSLVYSQSLPSNSLSDAKNLSEQRLDLVVDKIKTSLEHGTVDVYGKGVSEIFKDKITPGKRPVGKVRFNIKQKPAIPKDRNTKDLKNEKYGEKGEGKSVFNSFVNQLSDKKSKEVAPKKEVQ